MSTLCVCVRDLQCLLTFMLCMEFYLCVRKCVFNDTFTLYVNASFNADVNAVRVNVSLLLLLACVCVRV
jgi:hypothetical protein